MRPTNPPALDREAQRHARTSDVRQIIGQVVEDLEPFTFHTSRLLVSYEIEALVKRLKKAVRHLGDRDDA
jgi:hypothetical protein